MSEDLTQKLPDSRPFEERVLAALAEIRSEQAATRRDIAALAEHVSALETRVAALEDRMTKFETRLTALEDKVDARLRETRPIWESVQQQLTEMKAQMTAIETRMGAMENTLDLIRLQIAELYGDSIAVRARFGRLEQRERQSTG